VLELEIFVPFPPTINSYYVQTQRGRFISKKGRKFREMVGECVHQQIPNMGIPSETRVLMEVVVHMPDKRVRDLDNYMKPLLDALTHAEVWADDSQVDQLLIYRGVINKMAGLSLRISEGGPLLPVGTLPP